MQLILHKPGKLAKTHIDYSLGLDLIQSETVHKVLYGIIRCLGFLDDLNHLINVI